MILVSFIEKITTVYEILYIVLQNIHYSFKILRCSQCVTIIRLIKVDKEFNVFQRYILYKIQTDESTYLKIRRKQFLAYVSFFRK
jgi:hypothetical protein